VGRRLLTLVGMVAGIALLIAGVAFAAGDLAQSDETTTTTTVAADPAALDDSSTSTTASTETPAVGEDVTTVEDVPTSPHDGGWGTYISGLREAGIKTPAAVLMGKTVPGWEKKQPPATDTPTTEAPATDEASSQATVGHGRGHSKK
jgi:hypothetical protein